MITWIIYNQPKKSATTNSETIVRCNKEVGQRAERNSRSLIDWQDESCKRTTLLTNRAVQLSTAKVYVFPDLVLCMGRISENPVSAWKEIIDWFMNSSQCLELDRMCSRICEKIRARTLVVSWAWIRKEMVRNSHVQTEWKMGSCR